MPDTHHTFCKTCRALSGKTCNIQCSNKLIQWLTHIRLSDEAYSITWITAQCCCWKKCGSLLQWPHLVFKLLPLLQGVFTSLWSYHFGVTIAVTDCSKRALRSVSHPLHEPTACDVPLLRGHKLVSDRLWKRLWDDIQTCNCTKSYSWKWPYAWLTDDADACNQSRRRRRFLR